MYLYANISYKYSISVFYMRIYFYNPALLIYYFTVVDIQIWDRIDNKKNKKKKPSLHRLYNM